MDAVARPDCPGCRERDQAIAELREQIAALGAEVASLARKLDERPQPPRGPGGMPPAPAKKPTGRKRGGQPRHPPHLKELIPAERVERIVPLVPDVCTGCQTALSAVPTAADLDADAVPLRHQVAELPELAARITEYQAHARTCPCCGRLNQPTIPASIRRRCLGERLNAVLAYLVGSHGVSKRGVEEMCRAKFWSHSLPNWGCMNFGSFGLRLPNSCEFWRSRGVAMGAMRRRWPGGASVGVAGQAR